MLHPFFSLSRRLYRTEFLATLRAFKSKKHRLNAQARRGLSLLHLAVIENSPSTVSELLDLKADPKCQNCFGMTPIDYAHLLNRKKCLSLLQKKRTISSILVYRNSTQKMHSLPIEEFERKVEARYSETLTFEHPFDVEWVAKKSSGCLKKKNLNKMNQWMLALHHNHLTNPPRDHIYIRWIDPCLGYGVFAAKDLPALTYIAEYTGIVKVRTRKNSRHNDYIFGYMLGPKNSPFMIDAREVGNFTRLINHSIKPNIISRWVIFRGVTHIAFFSKKFIPKGKQLTYDYGPYYWKKRSDPVVIA